MKKIITLFFFAGVLTSAFAQPDRHQQYGNHTNDNMYQSPKNSGNNDYPYSKSHQDDNVYNENSKWNKRNNENEFGYHKDNDRNRDDIRRNQYHHPEYFNQRRNDDDSYRTRSRVPLLQIIFGIGG